MAELPEEIITMIKKRWAEMNEGASKAKKQNRTFTCKNCHCYKCCRHVWMCGKCRIEKETFHKWINQNKQDRERRERERGVESSRGGKGGFSKRSRGEYI